jgi:hypothetical protein
MLQSFGRERFAADIPILIRRISTDDKEIRTRCELAVARPGWQDCDVARIHVEFMAILASQD